MNTQHFKVVDKYSFRSQEINACNHSEVEPENANSRLSYFSAVWFRAGRLAHRVLGMIH